MKRPNFKNLKKRYIFLVVFLVVILVYLFFAYNYFYYSLGRNNLAWPENHHTYQLNGTSSSHNKIYVALGDSLTYGVGVDAYEDSYTYQVATNLAANGQSITLKDLSYPGFTSKNVLSTLDTAIAAKPDIVSVLVGVNDNHELSSTSTFKNNYDQILHRLHSETNAKIYVINEPFIGAPSILLPPFNYYYDAKIHIHNRSIKELADKYTAVYIDLYSATADLFKKNGPHYATDSFHPSKQGYKIWADTIKHDIR